MPSLDSRDPPRPWLHGGPRCRVKSGTYPMGLYPQNCKHCTSKGPDSNAISSQPGNLFELNLYPRQNEILGTPLCGVFIFKRKMANLFLWRPHPSLSLRLFMLLPHLLPLLTEHSPSIMLFHSRLKTYLFQSFTNLSQQRLPPSPGLTPRTSWPDRFISASRFLFLVFTITVFWFRTADKVAYLSAFGRMTIYTVSQKTSHLWLAITLTHTRERILISFGRSVTDKVSNQKKLYYATSNNLFLHYLAKRKNTKNAFFTQMLY